MVDRSKKCTLKIIFVQNGQYFKNQRKFESVDVLNVFSILFKA